MKISSGHHWRGGWRQAAEIIRLWVLDWRYLLGQERESCAVVSSISFEVITQRTLLRLHDFILYLCKVPCCCDVNSFSWTSAFENSFVQYHSNVTLSFHWNMEWKHLFWGLLQVIDAGGWHGPEHQYWTLACEIKISSQSFPFNCAAINLSSPWPCKKKKKPNLHCWIEQRTWPDSMIHCYMGVYNQW